MKTRRSCMVIAVAGVALVGLIVCGVIGFVIWEYRKIRNYQQQVDTHDLRFRTQKMVHDYLEERAHAAVVVGLVQQGKTFWSGFGHVSATNTNAPDTNTVFEIGSITKVFTGTALAQMVVQGKVRLDDTLGKLLPKDVTLPTELQAITLEHLATHTAGLPRLPANLDGAAANPDNPYARYTEEDLYLYLKHAKLDGDPGKESSYSNLGVGLLGHILALRSEVSYEKLLKGITGPLGMADTVITLSPAQRERLAPGHDAKGMVVSNWDFSVLAPAGALRSTAGDLLKFIQANLSTNHAELGPVLATAQKIHFQSWMGNVGLCWHEFEIPTVISFLWHNGGTGGYVSYLGFNSRDRTGIVVLSNYGDAMDEDSSLDEIGMELLKLASKVSWE